MLGFLRIALTSETRGYVYPMLHCPSDICKHGLKCFPLKEHNSCGSDGTAVIQRSEGSWFNTADAIVNMLKCP